MSNYNNIFGQVFNEITDNINNNSYSSAPLYQNIVDYDERCYKSNNLCIKYPDLVPVIINCIDKDIKLEKVKYLIGRDAEASKLIITLRKQIKLDSSKAVFLFIDNILVNSSSYMGELYDNYKLKHNIKPGDDLYFYISLQGENTFG